MRILLLCHGFNALAQRVHVSLSRLGHEVAIEFDVNDVVTAEAVAMMRPDVVVAPFLKRAIAPEVFTRVPCLIVHPGIPGDRGPSSLDWAIQEGRDTWGVTVLQATAEMDGGPVWAWRGFPMRAATKSSIYRREVRDAACEAVMEALARMEAGEAPTAAQDLCVPLGFERGPMRQADRAIDWSRMDTAEVLRRIRAADGTPGVLESIGGREMYLHGAHDAKVPRPGEPGRWIARLGDALLRATVDGAVWITHLRAKPGAEPTLKRPAAQVVPSIAASLPEWRDEAPLPGVRYEERGAVGVLHFDFLNGAMGVEECRALREAYSLARARPTRAIVLAGGPDYWSNGIDLNAIESSPTAAEASWESINAIDDFARDVLTTRSHLVVSAVGGDAGAGGAFLALTADRVLLRRGAILNPHYRGMGNLHGSEYWTYVLPRRVGEAQARAIAERRLPMGCGEALELGLADAVLDGTPEAFLDAACAWTDAWANAADFPALLARRNADRDRDEAVKPLEAYRAEELERMRLNFFGFDPSYHVARYNFIYKIPKARTPSWLAFHRVRQTGV